MAATNTRRGKVSREPSKLTAVEIEEAISAPTEQLFNSAAFCFAFLEAFWNKATTIKRLQSGSTSSSDIFTASLEQITGT